MNVKQEDHFRLEELRRIQAETCKIFGNEKRLLILECIWDRQVPFSRLLELTGLDKVTLSQQTAIMRRNGILRSERTSDGLVFGIANPKTLEAFQLMREVVIEKITKDSGLLDKG
jgi:DNA-binding transcriptional ArsR family regulator